MSGYDVFNALRRWGLKVALRSDGLWVSPRNRVTSEALEFVREHKQILMAMLERSVVGSAVSARGTGSDVSRLLWARV